MCLFVDYRKSSYHHRNNIRDLIESDCGSGTPLSDNIHARYEITLNKRSLYYGKREDGFVVALPFLSVVLVEDRCSEQRRRDIVFMSYVSGRELGFLDNII